MKRGPSYVERQVSGGVKFVIGFVEEGEHGSIELWMVFYVRGMSGAGDYFNPSVTKFAAHLFRDQSEFVVVFAYDAKHWDLELWKEFVDRRLDTWIGGA